jgi:hypothetical protein
MIAVAGFVLLAGVGMRSFFFKPLAKPKPLLDVADDGIGEDEIYMEQNPMTDGVEMTNHPTL